MTLSIQVAKFKFRQYTLKAISPNFNAHQSYPLYCTLRTWTLVKSVASYQSDFIHCLANVSSVAYFVTVQDFKAVVWQRNFEYANIYGYHRWKIHGIQCPTVMVANNPSQVLKLNRSSVAMVHAPRPYMAQVGRLHTSNWSLWFLDLWPSVEWITYRPSPQCVNNLGQEACSHFNHLYHRQGENTQYNLQVCWAL